MKELSALVLFFLISCNAYSADNVFGEFHADTRSSWGWVVILKQNSKGQMIAIEIPNECDPCVNKEDVLDGVWTKDKGIVEFTDSNNQVYQFKIIDENTLKLIAPIFPDIESNKLMFHKKT